MRHYPEWLHWELKNWAAWCWLGAYPHPLPDTTCASIEREYIHERNPEARQETDRRTPPNERNALIVDRVWRQLDLRPRMVLRAEYPQYAESGRAEFGKKGAARRLGLSIREYEAALTVAIGAVWAAFDA